MTGRTAGGSTAGSADRSDQDLDARGVLARFDRWPTWMWANQDVAEFLDWLHEWNLARPLSERVGFYGLDVYSLWDSLREIISWLEANAPEAIPTALRAWLCFVPYREDPHEYAWSTRLVPESCEADVVKLLVEVRRQAGRHPADDEAAFDAAQNAVVAANAERYYRIMMRGNRDSWNLRDHHMADTIDRLVRHHGLGSKGLVWEHNTHIGDARATDMAKRWPHQCRSVGPRAAFRGRRGADRLRCSPWNRAGRGLLGHPRAGVSGAASTTRQPRRSPASHHRCVRRSDFWRESPGSVAVESGKGTGRSALSIARSGKPETTSPPKWAVDTTR